MSDTAAPPARIPRLRDRGDLHAFLTGLGWEVSAGGGGPSPSYDRGQYRITVRRRDDVEDEWSKILVYDLQGSTLQLAEFHAWGGTDKLAGFLALYDDRLPRKRTVSEVLALGPSEQLPYVKWLLKEYHSSLLDGSGHRAALYSTAAYDLLHSNASVKLEVCLDAFP